MMIFAAIVLGICIGVALGALGGGGSILTVPALVYVLGQPLQIAVTESLVIVGITSLFSAIAHARASQVRWRAGVALGAIGGVAAWAGTALGRLVPPNVVLGTFAVLLLVVSISLVRRTMKPKSVYQPTDSLQGNDPGKLHELTMVATSTIAKTVAPTIAAGPSPRVHPYKIAIKVLLAGVVIGILTGFFGVGGGFIIVPVLVIALGYPMPIAVGTSLLVISLNSAVALTARTGHGALDWSIILPVTVAAVVGGLLGKILAQRISAHALTRAFAALLVAVSIYVGLRSSGLLPG